MDNERRLISEIPEKDLQAEIISQMRLLIQNLQLSRVEEKAMAESLHRLRMDLEVSSPVRFLLGMQSVLMTVAIIMAWWHGKL